MTKNLECYLQTTISSKEVFIIFENTKKYEIDKFSSGGKNNIWYYIFKSRDSKIWWDIQFKLDKNNSKIVYPVDLKNICFSDPLAVYNDVLEKKTKKNFISYLSY